ncbi:MAG: Fic family protein [Patescibacteria group bacterium]|nr:Fic family protein [Patescibacteria group bacterium]
MPIPKDIQKRLQDKLKQLSSLRPLPPSAVKKLREKFEVEMTYNSNAIEGNSLTERETFLVLNEGITIKNKPLKDHLEATNHKEALEYLYDLVGHDKQNTVSEHLIKNLHQIITKETEKDWAGRYRNAKVIIGGARHQPPDAMQIPNLMNELITWISTNQQNLHPVELAAILHHKFTHIHPFFDGNGRTGRLLMNIIIMQAGYPLTIILKNDRKKYYQVLTAADEGDCQPLIEFITKNVERSLAIYLDTLTPSSKKTEIYISLKEASQSCNYSEKYLNLLAAQNKLEAHKKGRNWVTTKEAIDRYINSRKRKR